MLSKLPDLNFENAVNYHYDQFPPNNLDYAKIIRPLALATDAIARYDQMLKNMHNSEILLAPLRNQEAIISSRMEGTISTMDEILRYEADFDEDEYGVTQTRSEVIETLLYQRALKSAQQSMENGRQISSWFIRAIHQRLLFLGRGAEKNPGKFKNEQNYLADKTQRNILFVPISPEKLIDGLDSLFEYIANKNELDLIKTAVSHVEFEALHPFKDGNGRIGRMLITLMLWNAGVISEPHFYISAYLEEQKDLYIDCMREVSRSGDWTGWCCFFLEALEKQAMRNLKVVEEITTLYNEMKSLFRKKLSSKWHVKALDYIFTNPVFRNNKFTKGSGIPSTTAAKFSRTLVDEGLLRTLEEASGRRPALYSFEPLMNLVRV
ncbi:MULTISPECIES: Fic/DOC family N-terminal domain-containing protein [unclassified Pseudodesulfovibrio]|uniref:Fic family protein n=1 Tax=unclassified Pseudodesulfovibrio TaxID=2661612 RepID=UPI000FEC061B|nr:MULTISPECIES: Fic/DOC family N-terminal domain-containing protein [unclassified Pseudodesulfovibrio]MCJ2165631.1 Fic family protein [Pseudodesulfovibrio sp. S3-i]RWU03038.1 Fic family protein [Pseudodesulfovibrio sp. S3]